MQATLNIEETDGTTRSYRYECSSPAQQTMDYLEARGVILYGAPVFGVNLNQMAHELRVEWLAGRTFEWIVDKAFFRPESSCSDEDVARLSDFEAIELVHLGGANLTHRAIGSLHSLPRLRSLLLRGAQFDDRAVPLIVGMTELRELEIGDAAFSEGGKKTLRAGLVGVEIFD